MIDEIVPPAGEVKNTPGFFLSSKIFVPTLTRSPVFTNIVGFIPMKSLERSETEFTVGVSVITGKGVPEIGRSKPFFILITCAMP